MRKIIKSAVIFLYFIFAMVFTPYEVHAMKFHQQFIQNKKEHPKVPQKLNTYIKNRFGIHPSSKNLSA
jgi:hypothetical protein